MIGALRGGGPADRARPASRSDHSRDGRTELAQPLARRHFGAVGGRCAPSGQCAQSALVHQRLRSSTGKRRQGSQALRRRTGRWPDGGTGRACGIVSNSRPTQSRRGSAVANEGPGEADADGLAAKVLSDDEGGRAAGEDIVNIGRVGRYRMQGMPSERVLVPQKPVFAGGASRSSGPEQAFLGQVVGGLQTDPVIGIGPAGGFESKGEAGGDWGLPVEFGAGYVEALSGGIAIEAVEADSSKTSQGGEGMNMAGMSVPASSLHGGHEVRVDGGAKATFRDGMDSVVSCRLILTPSGLRF